ncbi:hypothetical protein ACWEPI_39365, partial [Streptomyces sp. NPDC004262]
TGAIMAVPAGDQRDFEFAPQDLSWVRAPSASFRAVATSYRCSEMRALLLTDASPSSVSSSYRASVLSDVTRCTPHGRLTVV